EGPAMVGQTLQQLLFDRGELSRSDFVVARMLVVGEREHLVLAAEVLSEERINEGDVVVDPSHLENLVAAQAQLFVPAAAGLVVLALFPFGPELALVPPLLNVAEQFD